MGARGALLGRGGTAEVYEWAPGQVLKLFTPAYAYSADAEFERTRAVHAAGVRCPAVLERVSVEGRVGIVFERVDGPTLLEAPAKSRVDVAVRLAELHAEVHAHDGVGLPSFDQVLQSVAPRLEPRDRERTLACAARVPKGRAVCHALFHPGHVLLGERGPVIIDWPDAFASHPALDVARTCVFLLYLGLEQRPDAGARTRQREARERFRDAYLERYLACGGVSLEEVERCLPLPALALLRAMPAHPERARLEELASQRPR